MKITKDILNFLSIDNVYLQSNKETYRCFILKIKGDFWIVSTETDCVTEKITLKINTNNNIIKLEAELDSFIEETEINSFIFALKILKDDNLDETKKTFFDKLNELENKHIEWNKRKEERYEIGINEKKCKLFSLKSLEQKIVFENIQLPCLINNISYSGAKITTFESDFYKEKKIILCLSFIQPIEQIQLVATIKNTSLKILDNKQTISILSLNFDSPSLSFKERLSNYIKELNNDSKNNL